MAIRYLEATRELVVQLRYGDPRKDEVKALGARYNGSDQGWHLRADLDPERVGKLESLGFEMPAAWRAALATGPQETGPVSAQLSETVVVQPAARGRTVGEVANELRAAVARAMPETQWIRGIARLRFSPRPGTALYFELAELDGAGGELAKMTAVIWSSDVERVLRPLRDAGLDLSDGLPVCLRAKVGFSVKQGRGELQVQEFDPAASLGEIALQRDKVLRALAAEGLSKVALQRPLPLLPMRVALVSSVGSDGHRDFCTQLQSSGYGFAVRDFDVRVQGDALERTVLDAFAAIDAQCDAFDLVVVTRGGGGKGDLAGWDNLAVCRAVARCSVKVLIAIGHTNDATALDSIALSMPTPTAAGRFLVEQVTQADQRAADAIEQIVGAARRSLLDADEAIHAAAITIAEQAGALVEEGEARLSLAAGAVEIRVSNRVRIASERLATFVRAVERAPLALRAAGSELDRAAVRVARGTARLSDVRGSELARMASSLQRAAPAAVARAEQQLRMPELAVRMADPANVLRRGFALLRDGEGRVLASAASLRPGDALTVDVRDGRLRTRVESLETTELRAFTREPKP